MLSAAYCYQFSKVPFTNDYYVKTFGYCYHLVNVITFGLAQSDHIKRLLLYYIFVAIGNKLRNEVERKCLLMPNLAFS